MTFLEVIIWSKLEDIIWSKLVRLKKRQLGPDNNFQFFLRAICFQNKCAETTIFIVFFLQSVFQKKTNLDQIITSKTPNLDQIITPQHIYIYAVVRELGPLRRGILSPNASRCRTEHFDRGNPGHNRSYTKRPFEGPDSPAQGTRFPPTRLSVENALWTTAPMSPKLLFLQWFRAKSAQFQRDPQNRREGMFQRVWLPEVSFEGGIFVT